MRVDVMPELAKEDLIGVVLNIGLGVGNLKIGAELERKEKIKIAENDHRLKFTHECRP